MLINENDYGIKGKIWKWGIFYFNLKYYDHFDTMQSQHEIADEEIERSIPRDSSKLSASVTCMLTCWVHSTDDAGNFEKKYCKPKNTRFQIPVKSLFCDIIYYCRIYLSIEYCVQMFCFFAITLDKRAVIKAHESPFYNFLKHLC